MEWLKVQLQTNKLAKIIEIISIFLAAYVIIELLGKPGTENLVYNQLIVWVANIIMLAMVWAGLKIRGENWEAFGLSFKKTSFKRALKTFLLSLLVFALALAALTIGSIIVANITGIPQSANMGNYSYLRDNLGMFLLSLAGVYVISSFGAEIIYRGFLINRISELGLNGKRGLIIAVIISTVVFGIAHYSWGPMGIVQAGFMGLVLGLCYIFMKKRLWIIILAHAYLDTILLVQIYLVNN